MQLLLVQAVEYIRQRLVPLQQDRGVALLRRGNQLVDVFCDFDALLHDAQLLSHFYLFKATVHKTFDDFLVVEFEQIRIGKAEALGVIILLFGSD